MDSCKMLTLTLLLVLIIVVCFFYIYFTNKSTFKYWKERNVKFLDPTPIFGSMLPLVLQSKSSAEFINDLYKSFPDEKYFGFYKFGTPILMIRDPDLCKAVMIKHFESFQNHGDILKAENDTLWTKNLLSSEGSRWRDLRQVISPVFTSKKMKMIFVSMEECALNFIQHFEAMSEKNKTIELEMKDSLSRYTNDAIALGSFGVKCDSFKNEDNEFFKYGKSLVDFNGLKRFKFFLYGNIPSIVNLLKLKIISKKVGDFFISVINETIKTREELNIIRPDLIHLLMHTRKEKLKLEKSLASDHFGFESSTPATDEDFLSNEDITAQAIIFYFGGFDTVSNVLSFTVYELAINPDVQTKLRKEISTILENDQITYDALMEMRYLDNVINESMRKWPQGLWLNRKCTKSTEISIENHKLTFNVGDIVWMPVYGIHHDPQYFPNPERFDPDRFNVKGGIDSATFLPFGAGPRNCIGSRFALLGMKILLVHLLNKFEIVPVEKTEIPLKIKKDAVILMADKGIHLGLKPLPQKPKTFL